MQQSIWSKWVCGTAAAIALLVVVHGAAAAAGGGQKSPKGSPNIIFIMADDLGYGELGCYGQQKIATPNIDRLCAEGMKFTDYYAGSTVCAPSRSVLMTGRHMGHTHVRGNAGKGNMHIQSLRPEDVTVAEVLKQAGYTNGITGKWGLGDLKPGAEAGLPENQGFDLFFGYYNQRHAHNYFPDHLYRNQQRVPLANEGNFDEDGAGKATVTKVYAHDLVLDESLKFIEANRDKRFFLFCSWTLPHGNNEDPKNGAPDFGMYADKDWTDPNKLHAAMVTYLDTQVGKLLAALDAHGLRENTIVFFTSDNGPHRESGGNNPDFFESSGIVRGIKRDLYDGGIRVPMIVRWPGKVAAGSVTDHVSYHGDIMATLAEIAGVKTPENLDSISFLPTLLGDSGAQKKHEYLYWEFYEQGSRQAVRFGEWKAVRKPMITGPIEIYNIDADPKELTNLAADRPELVKKAAAIMKEAHVPNPNWNVPAPKQPRKKPVAG